MNCWITELVNLFLKYYQILGILNFSKFNNNNLHKLLKNKKIKYKKNYITSFSSINK